MRFNKKITIELEDTFWSDDRLVEILKETLARKTREAKIKVETTKYIDVLIIPISDKPNLNGHLYTEECIKKVYEDLSKAVDDGRIFVRIGYPSRLEAALNDVAFNMTKVRLEDKGLYGDMQVAGPKAEQVAELLKSGAAVVRPMSVGQKNDDGTIDVKNILSFSVVRKTEDAFGNII